MKKNKHRKSRCWSLDCVVASLDTPFDMANWTNLIELMQIKTHFACKSCTHLGRTKHDHSKLWQTQTHMSWLFTRNDLSETMALRNAPKKLFKDKWLFHCEMTFLTFQIYSIWFRKSRNIKTIYTSQILRTNCISFDRKSNFSYVNIDRTMLIFRYKQTDISDFPSVHRSDRAIWFTFFIFQFFVRFFVFFIQFFVYNFA